MQAMFKGASTFNVYIGNWSTLQLTNTIEMFKNATSFNHDLSFWNISQLTDATEMFDGSGLSTANYDALLVGWANQAPNIQSNVDFGAQGIQYTIGISQAARDTLTNAPYNWSIADGGGI
jgi:hypothetical protein